MQPQFKVDLRAFTRSIENMKAKQLPFATSLAINKTLNDARDAIVRTMPQVFDAPTAWAMRGVKVEYSKKTDLRGRVFLEGGGSVSKGVPAERFLLAQVISGERRYKKFEKALQSRGLLPEGMYAVATKIAPKDQHGNVPGSFIVQILSYLQAFGEQGYRSNMARGSRGRRKLDKAGVGYFVGRPGKGHPLGVWERRTFASGSAVRPLFLFVQQARYSTRLDFYGIAERTFAERFPVHFQAAFDQAMRTAR